MKHRVGITYRVYDHKNLTVALHPGAYSKGKSRKPDISIIWRRHIGLPAPQVQHIIIDIPLPLIGWGRAYRWRKIGGLWLWKNTTQRIDNAFYAPIYKEELA